MTDNSYEQGFEAGKNCAQEAVCRFLMARADNMTAYTAFQIGKLVEDIERGEYETR